MSTQTRKPVAERITGDFLKALNSSGSPPMETLSPDAARSVLAEAQSSAKVSLPPVDVIDDSIEVEGQTVPLKILRPAGAQGMLPAFMFFHGGGWVLGDFPTHERLVRDLVHYSGAAAVYVEYSRSPEVQYPVASRQVYAATRWAAEEGQKHGLDGSRLAVAGNSVGGNFAATTALRCHLENGPKLRCQLLLWPVTNADFNTASYEAFQEGHFLTRNMMQWFWNNYAPQASQRKEIYASPLLATPEQLRGLPPAIVQTAELDVLRDEGEAYAVKLDQAGVEVTSLRVNGMIHDYGLLNPLAHVPAVQAALRQAGRELQHYLR